MEQELLFQKRMSALNFLSIALKNIYENNKQGSRFTYWEHQLIDAFEKYCNIQKPNERFVLIDQIEYQIYAIQGRIKSNPPATNGERNLFLMVYNLL